MPIRRPVLDQVDATAANTAAVDAIPAVITVCWADRLARCSARTEMYSCIRKSRRVFA